MALSVVAIKAAKPRDKAYKLTDGDGRKSFVMRSRLPARTAMSPPIFAAR